MYNKLRKQIRTATGPTIIAAGSLATLWLAATEKLTLYIHPRYLTFSIVLAAIGLTASILAATQQTKTPQNTPPTGKNLRLAARILLLATVTITVLVIPPKPLTLETALQRSTTTTPTTTATNTENTDVKDAQPGTTPNSGNTETGPAKTNNSSDNLRDWAYTVRAGNAQGKTAVFEGFITPTQTPDEFNITRFFVSCCAVDAQPVTIPVYLPGWKNHYKTGDWVRSRGSFALNPELASPHETIFMPRETKKIQEPKNPYVY